MRLIDADKLSDYLQNHYNEVEALHRPNDSEYLCGIGTCLDSIDADSFEVPDSYPAWISVKNQLPEKLENVIVFTEGCVDVGYLTEDGFGKRRWETDSLDEWGGGGGGREVLKDVTHWMPLPEEPKE
mgnify:FL=1